MFSLRVIPTVILCFGSLVERTSSGADKADGREEGHLRGALEDDGVSWLTEGKPSRQQRELGKDTQV